MSDKLVLHAETRAEKGKQNKKLRDAGRVPAVVYGSKADSQPLSVESKVLEKIYAQAGGNKIIGLKIDEARQKNVLIHDVQQDARLGTITHADLYLVRMDEKLKTEIPLHFIGESTAVYQDEGTLVRPLDTIEVEALPGDLPENIEVDISVLDDFDKSIHVSDLKVPGDVEVLTDADALVAKVDKPRTDDELAELDEAVVEELPEDVEEDVEVVEDGKEPTRKEPEGKADGV